MSKPTFCVFVESNRETLMTLYRYILDQTKLDDITFENFCKFSYYHSY